MSVAHVSPPRSFLRVRFSVCVRARTYNTTSYYYYYYYYCTHASPRCYSFGPESRLFEPAVRPPPRAHDTAYARPDRGRAQRKQHNTCACVRDNMFRGIRNGNDIINRPARGFRFFLPLLFRRIKTLLCAAIETFRRGVRARGETKNVRNENNTMNANGGCAVVATSAEYNRFIKNACVCAYTPPPPPIDCACAGRQRLRVVIRRRQKSVFGVVRVSFVRSSSPTRMYALLLLLLYFMYARRNAPEDGPRTSQTRVDITQHTRVFTTLGTRSVPDRLRRRVFHRDPVRFSGKNNRAALEFDGFRLVSEYQCGRRPRAGHPCRSSVQLDLDGHRETFGRALQ